MHVSISLYKLEAISLVLISLGSVSDGITVDTFTHSADFWCGWNNDRCEMGSLERLEDYPYEAGAIWL